MRTTIWHTPEGYFCKCRDCGYAMSTGNDVKDEHHIYLTVTSHAYKAHKVESSKLRIDLVPVLKVPV